MEWSYLKITLATINGVWKRVPVDTDISWDSKEEITVGLVNSSGLEMER